MPEPGHLTHNGPLSLDSGSNRNVALSGQGGQIAHPLASGGAVAVDGTKPVRIDTHAHVFHRGLPMLEGRRYTPGYDATLENYLQQLDNNGLTHGILVQPSFLGEDNGFMLESIAAAHGRLRGIAVVGPTLSQKRVQQLRDGGVIGVRINLIGQRIPNLNTPEWSRALNELISAGMYIEVYGRSTALAIIVPMLLAKGANVILDHVAMPDPQLGIYDPHFETVLDLALTRKVWCKISAPYRSGPHGHTNALEAYPELVLAFKTDRILWGSDWPHTQHENAQHYRKTVEFFESVVPDPAERAKILGNFQALF
ncbi:MAG: amidohydrolase family protein [Hyphomicrobiales bacterium]|nr:amidohydrolase family protein [Hyphomicrobiales bacterium]MDE2115153.1 amidohydrolase family protein [Hyphomicrobiales bacterium]